MTPYLVLDIETVANANASKYYATKVYNAPANYKDADKIAAYVLEAKHTDQRKAALTWWTGKVVCACLRSPTLKPVTIYGDDEKALLMALFDFLETSDGQLIGKNLDTFDRPYLIGRAMAHNLGVPAKLRPYRGISDVNEIFGYGAMAGQRSTLADYAFGLGIGQKLAHGSDVQGWYDQACLGDQTMWPKIGQYCAQDVDLCWEILARFQKPYQASKKAPLVDESPLPPIEIPFG